MDLSRLIKSVIEKLGSAVNNHCTCGGRGPEDTGACPACLVWHELKPFLNELIR